MKFNAYLSLIPLMAVACSGEPAEEATTGPSTACAGDGMVVSDAWMRTARPGQPTSAAYFTLCNGGQNDDALVSVAFAGAQAAELHVTTMGDDAMASMAPTQQIMVSAGQIAKLEPEGAHVMLIGLTAPLAADDKPTATLTFKNAPPINVEFEVRGEMHGDGAHH